MNVLLIDNGTTLLAKLQNLIPGAEVVCRWQNVTPQDVDVADLVILSGSSSSSVVWNHDLFTQEIALIREAKKPIIGICFGCELMVYALGGTLKELPKKHSGTRTIVCDDPLFSSKKQLSVYENHRWIIDTVPSEFVVLAHSEDGPEAVRHQVLPLYGLQFHPEQCIDQNDGREVFLKLFERLGR